MKFNGQALKTIRDKAGLTQEQLAAASGATFGTINRLENGHVQPTLATVQKIADALGVEPTELLTLNGEAVA
jgi:transcriptional regulator with XRE-family HTH domain